MRARDVPPGLLWGLMVGFVVGAPAAFISFYGILAVPYSHGIGPWTVTSGGVLVGLVGGGAAVVLLELASFALRVFRRCPHCGVSMRLHRPGRCALAPRGDR